MEKMNENQINVLLKNVQNYQGSFALDEIGQIETKSIPEFFILNLDIRAGGGNHWIAFAIYQNEVYICDSLGGLVPGKQFPKQLINFLHILTQNRKLYVTKQLQPLSSTKCGEYCVLFVKEMSKTNFCSFLSLFTTNLYQNDKIVSFLQ